MLVLQTKLNWICNLAIYVVFIANQITTLQWTVYKTKMSTTHIVYLNPNAFLICSSAKDQILEIISRKYTKFIYNFIWQNKDKSLTSRHNFLKKRWSIGYQQFFIVFPRVLPLGKLYIFLPYALWEEIWFLHIKIVSKSDNVQRKIQGIKSLWCWNCVCTLDVGVFY